MAMKNPCKVITGRKTVFSYLNVNEPKVPMGGGTPKYSVSLIIPKSDTKGCVVFVMRRRGI